MPKGQMLTAELLNARWNNVLHDFETLAPSVRLGKFRGGGLNHPWKTKAARWNDSDDPLLWRVDVALGCVNDAPPVMIYQAKDDPRKWVPPAAVPPNITLIERSLAEHDTPWFLFRAPKPGGQTTSADKFTLVSNAARPAFFRTAQMWQVDLYQSSVFLSDNVSEISADFPSNIQDRLKKQLRLRNGRPLTPTVGGGLLELARLYLLRHPDDTTGAADAILVRQFVFWSVWSELITTQFNADLGTTDFADFVFWTV